MMNNTTDPYGDDGYGGGGSSGGGGDPGGTDPGGVTGGTDPSRPPNFKPGGNGWWEFVAGAWRWVTEPLPRAYRI